MPYAVIFKNLRTPYYDIVIQSTDQDDLGLLRGYAAYFCSDSKKYLWSEEEYFENGMSFVTEYSMVVSDLEKIKQFKNRGIALSIYVHMVYERLQLLGTVEYGIKYFSKFAFSSHRNLHRLTLIDKERFLDNIECMTPQNLLLHYIKMINHRKILVIHTDDMFCLSPLSSPTNI